MTGEDKKPFWDRYDIHVKRWQTTLALIVALGAVIAFGVKFPWNEYWPFKDDSPPRTSSGEITTEVRSLSPTWAASIEIDKGIDPIIEVQIEFDNVTGQNADDVVVNLVAPRQLHAIPDGVQLIDAAHSQGFSLGDQILTDTGENIGNYTVGSNAFIRVPFMMRSDEVPCGKSTFTFRSYVRITDMDMKKAVYSPEAVASYTRHC